MAELRIRGGARVVTLIGALLAFGAALALHQLRNTDVDDSWIHLRVALNWASGLGPVYNAGEHVEASTSPAWLALLTLGIRLGFDGPSWALGLALASAAAVGAGASLLAFRLSPAHGSLAGVLAAFLTASNVTFTYWASTRMEVAFACAILIWSVHAALSTRALGGALTTALLAALGALARPEFASVVPLLIGLAVMQVPRERRFRLALTAGGAAFALLAAHLLARYSYYGLLVPNTYIAKVAGKSLGARLHSSVDVLLDFVRYQPLLVVGLAWAGVRSRGVPRWLAAGCALLLGAVAWSGGDHFVYCRLAVPIVPVASALVASALCALAVPVQLALAALFLVDGVYGFRHWGWRGTDSALFVLREEAVVHAMKHFPAGPLATLGIGVIGYRLPERRIIDLVGLADAQIARSPHIPGCASGHDHSDPKYVIAQRPAVVFPHILTTDHPLTAAEELQNLAADRKWYQSGLDLLQNPEFTAHYRAVNLALDDGRFFRIWARRELSLAGIANQIVP